MGPDFKAVLPKRHYGYVMRNEEGHDWLADMLSMDRILFADNILELFEYAIEGQYSK